MNIFIIILVLIIIIFIFNNYNINIQEKLNNVENNDIKKIDQNICSKSCCNYNQYGKNDKKDNKYVSSNFFCNYGQGSGCLCVSKDDLNYLSSRGNNT